MNRLNTMARFEEPTEERPAARCEYCEAELYNGETVVSHEGNYYCDAHCLCNDIASDVTLGE